MTDAKQLLKIFRDKLEQTGSLDAAFLKAVWIAFNKGLEAGRQEAMSKENEK